LFSITALQPVGWQMLRWIQQKIETKKKKKKKKERKKVSVEVFLLLVGWD
jgi:hypothetical protein